MVKNLINNKIYIGKTTRNISIRWQEHKAAAKGGSKLKFHKALRKYGVDNWEISILEEINKDINVQDKEIWYINNFNSIKEGYNTTIGGEGTNYVFKTFVWVCEECGTNKILDKKYKNQIKRFCDKTCAAKHSNRLKWSTPDYKEKIKSSVSKAMQIRSGGVYLNDVYFNCLREASEQTNIPISTIFWRAQNNKMGWRLK